MNMPLQCFKCGIDGVRDKPEILGNISCKCVSNPCGCAGFMLSDATNISLKMLSLNIQLHNNSNYRLIEISGLSLFNISSLHITNCSVSLMAVYENTLRYSPCVMNISCSTHVELTYVHASNTNGRGIYTFSTPSMASLLTVSCIPGRMEYFCLNVLLLVSGIHWLREDWE